jgi:phosphonate transport system substrate-binding protein
MSDNKIKFKQLNSGSSSNVYKYVMIGRTEAGSTLDVNFLEESREVQSRIRIIHEGEKVPSHPISAHPRVDVSARERLIKAIFSISRNNEGREILKNINMPNPVKSDYNLDYLPLENIDIKKLSESK